MNHETLTFTEKQFVGIKDGLGFAIPYKLKKKDGTETAETKKRIQSVKKWVRGWNNKDCREFKILDNKPSTGFKIVQVCSRWSTSNKVFRIQDPRGFQLEIYCGNLLHLIQNCTIINGEIQEPLMWADTKFLVTHEDYGKALQIKEDKKKIRTIRPSTIEPGTRCELSDGSIIIYMGRFYSLNGDSQKLSIKWSGEKQYLFLQKSSLDKNDYTLYKKSSLKVVKIFEKIIDVEDSLKYLQEKILNNDSSYWSRTYGIRNIPSIIWVSDKKEDYKLSFVPYEHNERYGKSFMQIGNKILAKISSWYYLQYRIEDNKIIQTFYNSRITGDGKLMALAVNDRPIAIYF